MKIRSPRARKLLGLMSVVLLTLLSIAGCRAFGAAPAGQRLLRVQQSPEWRGDRLQNPQASFTNITHAVLRRVFGRATPGREPQAPVPVVTRSVLGHAPASGLRVTWFGHSSALLELDGVNVLIDPLWSERASPVPWLGPRRWYPPPVSLQQLPVIDVVVISHDHYDHLDCDTIGALSSWKNHFVVPLGVGAHLVRWGIPESRITELDWWQSTHVRGLEISATPARHASGRTGAKSNRTLWAGFAFIGARHRAWYSGDTGFHDELGRIGERFGPFDVTLIEAGQYDPDWPDAHLGPELALEAHRLVRGATLIPVHWGLLELANHPWTEPVERVLERARCRGSRVLVPRPGESLEPTTTAETTRWWPTVAFHAASERPQLATKNGDPAERVTLEACQREER